MADYSPVWHMDWLDDWYDGDPGGGSGGGGSGGGGSGGSASCVYGAFTVPSSVVPYDYAHRFVPFLDLEVPLYVVGWSYDGPCAKSVMVRSMDDVYSIFGGRMLHVVNLSPGQTSFTVPLRIAPDGWDVRVVSGGYRLNNVRITGTGYYIKTVQFDAVPASGTVEFRYHPASVWDDDIAYLPALLRSALMLGAGTVIGVRVPGGARAAGTWTAWSVVARNEGAIYNGTRVRVFNDYVSVQVPNRAVRTYARTSDMYSMFASIEEVQFIPPATPTWPSGLDVTLSGGRTVPFTGASLLALGNLWTPELPGVVLVPAMGVSDACYTVASAFAVAMEAYRCAVVYCTSVSNITGVTG